LRNPNIPEGLRISAVVGFVGRLLYDSTRFSEHRFEDSATRIVIFNILDSLKVSAVVGFVGRPLLVRVFETLKI
jgi:hypothetical protein